VLDAMATRQGSSLSQVLIGIDRARGERPLASACRVAALAWSQDSSRG
ncbi:MAG: aryl-sulfate sulfotransferase, partial [Oxalobacteraceae bacterium]